MNTIDIQKVYIDDIDDKYETLIHIYPDIYVFHTITYSIFTPITMNTMSSAR